MCIRDSDETMQESMAENTGDELSDQSVPGEAVFTSSSSLDSLSGAKLLKEQVRARNKETLLEIINNVNISDEQKQEAIDGMIAITDAAEKETAAEILLLSLIHILPVCQAVSGESLCMGRHQPDKGGRLLRICHEYFQEVRGQSGSFFCNSVKQRKKDLSR